jgi:hypothetical protein
MSDGTGIDWKGIEAEFKAGWDAWVARCDMPKNPSVEFVAGYDAAAHYNETHGDPPSFEDSDEMAAEYRQKMEAEWCASYSTFAD